MEIPIEIPYRLSSSPSSMNSSSSENSTLTTPSESDSEDSHSARSHDDEDVDEDEGDEEEEEEGDNDSDAISVEYNGPTPLYRAIELKSWGHVEKFLVTDEWDWKCGLFHSLYSASEMGSKAQVRTWVGTRDEGEDICRLPLHAAIVNKAPIHIIEALVKLYRKSVQIPDSDGNYPLHLAFHVGAESSVLVLLLKEFPAAINKKNAFSCLPDECGKGSDIGEVIRMCIDETKALINKEQNDKKTLESEKALWMENERELLSSVSSELKAIKEFLSGQDRKERMKEDILLKRNQMHGAITDLTKIVEGLEFSEQKLLKRTLEEERKRTDGIYSQLLQTQKELDSLKGVPQKRGKQSDVEKKSIPVSAIIQKRRKRIQDAICKVIDNTRQRENVVQKRPRMAGAATTETDSDQKALTSEIKKKLRKVINKSKTSIKKKIGSTSKEENKLTSEKLLDAIDCPTDSGGIEEKVFEEKVFEEKVFDIIDGGPAEIEVTVEDRTTLVTEGNLAMKKREAESEFLVHKSEDNLATENSDENFLVADTVENDLDAGKSRERDLAIKKSGEGNLVMEEQEENNLTADKSDNVTVEKKNMAMKKGVENISATQKSERNHATIERAATAKSEMSNLAEKNEENFYIEINGGSMVLDEEVADVHTIKSESDVTDAQTVKSASDVADIHTIKSASDVTEETTVDARAEKKAPKKKLLSSPFKGSHLINNFRNLETMALGYKKVTAME